MSSQTSLTLENINKAFQVHFSTNNQVSDSHVTNTDNSPTARFEVALSDAQRLLSNDDFAYYLDVISQFIAENRFDSIAECWVTSIPYLPQFTSTESLEVESDAVTKTIYSTTLALGKWVSTERQAQFLSALPQVARHLSSSKDFVCYLDLIEQLATKSPRNLKALLECAPLYIQALSITGFRAWALFGANVHAHQYDALDAYYSLTSLESQTVFQEQRGGTLFNHVQRQLHFFLRAIWGEDFFMRPIPIHHSLLGAMEPSILTSNAMNVIPRMSRPIPTIDNGVMLLPDALDARRVRQDQPIHSKPTNAESITINKRLYRAMSAHCAAHIKYSHPRLLEPFSPLERLCIELFEDARVEALAVEIFPGLKNLWLSFHSNELRHSNLPNDEYHQNDRHYLKILNDIAFSLLDMNTNPTISKAHHLVTASLNMFMDTFAKSSKDNNDLEIERLGCWLANAITKEFDLEGLALSNEMAPLVCYRDDNRSLWCSSAEELVHWEVQQQSQVIRTVSVTEMVNEIDCELADENAQEIWILQSEFFRDGDPENISLNEQDANKLTSPPYFYPEWDYGAQAHRPDWVTLTEKTAALGDPENINQILARRQTLVRNIKALVESLQPKGLVRLRKQYDGDGLDLDAVIEAMKELRRGALPEMNIDQRLKRHERDLAVLVLLDLSQSTLDSLPNDAEKRTVLHVTQEATVMLATALDGIGDAFAIHGFSSNGRQDVRYQRIKDFDQDYDNNAKSRLAGLQGGLSTRMGAALRHAKTFLAQQPQRKKLLLLVSDGEPADIDVNDPLYLQADTRKAVDDLIGQGVIPYCLTIDSNAGSYANNMNSFANNYVGQIFGKGHYTVLDNVAQLPDVLPSLFASLTRRAG